MKKVWRCSLCTQMCTRKENLKRHFSRLHNGEGHMVLQYVLGNSIITPEVTVRSRNAVLADEYGLKQKVPERPDSPKDPLIQSFREILGPEYKFFEPVFKIWELQSKVNSHIGRHNLSHPLSFQGRFISTPFTSGPGYDYPQWPLNPPNRLSAQEQYEGLTGFTSDVCSHCLSISIFPIRPDNAFPLHACIPGVKNATMALGWEKYKLELIKSWDYLPEFLFNECKNWAKNTTGHLYLTAHKNLTLSKNEIAEIETGYEKVPLIREVLSKTKIALSDEKLHQFLKIAKNSTRAAITINSNHHNLRYVLAVTTL